LQISSAADSLAAITNLCLARFTIIRWSVFVSIEALNRQLLIDNQGYLTRIPNPSRRGRALFGTSASHAVLLDRLNLSECATYIEQSEEGKGKGLA
jgi:hypothetical protein